MLICRLIKGVKFKPERRLAGWVYKGVSVRGEGSKERKLRRGSGGVRVR